MSRKRNDLDALDSFEDFEDIGISVMEELDPEPQPKSGSFYAREFVVGILLVLGVLAFAGWQWWQTEYRLSNYRMGEEAARQFDWDDASARFSAAEGYRDAGQRAKAAASRVHERDEHYSLGVEYFNNGRWAAALEELRTVREVQPGYRDAASMEERAEQQVYKDALLGAIVMRPEANPPGMYYRAESEWVWVEGSDAESRLWGQGTHGHVLYDAPIEGWVPPDQPSRRSNPSDLDEYRMSIAGRKLMVASFDTGGGALVASFQELPFNLSDFSWFEWNQKGVWGIRYSEVDLHSMDGPFPVYERIKYIQQITYHAFGTKIMRSTNPTYYGMNVALMDYNRNGDGLLVANWTRHDDGTFTVDLYLNSLGNGENRLLYTYDGGFVNARFSEEGRYVFLTTYKQVGNLLEDHTLLMIDTTGVDPVRPLLEQKGVHASNGLSLDGQQYMAAKLLQDGAFAGKVLLTQRISYTNYVGLLDLSGNQPVQEIGIGGNGKVQWDVVSTKGSDLVVWGTGSVNVTSTSTKEGQALFALQLENGEWSVAATRTIPPSSTVGPIQQRGGELLYLLYNYTPSGLRHTVELYGVSLSDLGPGAIPAKLLYTYQFPRSMDKRQSLGGFRYVFGPGMFAYLDGTTLRALTYDSETNLPLEDGVTDIFNVEPVAP